MKNLIKQNVDDLDNLPSRISGKKSHIIDKSWDCDYYHHEEGIYTIASRVVKANVGKSFDLAFSFFCKKVNHNQRYYSYFLDNFETRYRYQSINEFVIDENGNIQHCERYHEWNKNRTKKVSFVSKGYKTEWFHKETNHLMRDFKSIDRLIQNKRYYLYVGGNPSWMPIKQSLQYIACHDDFRLKVISGFAKEFSSVRDPEYRRLSTDARKRNESLKRKEKAELKKKEYCFLTKTELEIKQQKQMDHIKLLKHGFDENSFKYDPYHGKKKKI